MSYKVVIPKTSIKTVKYIILLAFGTIFLAPYNAHSYTVKLATGGEKGIYYKFGNAVANITNNIISIIPITTSGSSENLHLLNIGSVDAAIAQSDSIYFDVTRNKNPQYLAVMRLFPEYIHILVRKGLAIKNIREIKGKRVALGPKGSGTEANALAVLSASGISIADFVPLNATIEEYQKYLQNNDVDVLFITSACPSSAVKELEEYVSVFEPTPDTLDNICKTNPYFKLKDIPNGTYKNQDGDVTTISVDALLLIRKDRDTSIISDIMSKIFINKTTIFKTIGIREGLDIANSIPDKNIVPTSRVAFNYFKEKGAYKVAALFRIIDYGIWLLFIVAISFCAYYRKKIKLLFIKNDRLGIIFVLLFIWAVGACILYVSEHRINDHYHTLSISLWSSLLNCLSFGSKEPITATGRTTSVAMVIAGAGCLTWFTAELASDILKKKLFGRVIMSNINNHYVIYNWNGHDIGLLDKLRHDDVVEKRPIVVITNSQWKNKEELSEYENVICVNEVENLEHDFLNSKAQYAHSVILLADKNRRLSDSNTILAITALKKIAFDSHCVISVVAEITESKNVGLALFSGGGVENNSSKGLGLKLEVVSSEYIGMHLLAQAAAYPGVTRVYEELLRYGKNIDQSTSSEIYTVEIPSEHAGKFIFSDLIKVCCDMRSRNIYVLPLGIERKTDVYLNPSDNEIGVILSQDKLIVVGISEHDINRMFRTLSHQIN